MAWRKVDVEVASARSEWFASRLKCSTQIIDFSVYSSHYHIVEDLCDFFFEYLSDFNVPYPFDGQLADNEEVVNLVDYFGLTN